MNKPFDAAVAGKFFAVLDPSRHALGLFSHLHDLSYFMKDREGRFMAANDALVRLLGRNEVGEILGRTDHDLVSPYLADSYRRDDESVIKEGRSIINKVELVTHNDLSVGWFVTTKLPLHDRRGGIVGLEGVTREFRAASGALGPYPELSRVIDLVENRHGELLTVADLARAAGLAPRTLERLFRRRFHMTPFGYLKRVRLNAACRRLIHSNQTIAQIAAECGFCDQSYMTKEFARLLRVTPQVYRETHIK